MVHVYNWGRIFSCICIITLFSAATLQSPEKYTVKNGQISFVSNAELEVISASSKKLQGVIDASNNQFAFLVPVNSFTGFNGELQRIHFNEKYMESDKYANATFSGKIIEQIDFTKDGTFDVRAKGDLDIHGQKQIRIIKSKITIKSGTITIETSFKVPLADHNISIPTIVNQKIATEIIVNVQATLMHQ